MGQSRKSGRIKRGEAKTSDTSILTVFYIRVKHNSVVTGLLREGDYEGFRKLCFAVFGCDRTQTRFPLLTS